MSEELKASSISFEKGYADDSGVQFGVRLLTCNAEPEIELKSHSVSVVLPATELPWLLAALARIDDELP